MSEPKRVHFETISGGGSKNLSSTPSTGHNNTIRLELKLFEPNAESFPQFNFETLCRVEKVRGSLFLLLCQINVCKKKKQRIRRKKTEKKDREIESKNSVCIVLSIRMCFLQKSIEVSSQSMQIIVDIGEWAIH